MASEHNLIVDLRVKEDILAYLPPLRRQIVGFLMRLAANPFSPDIIDHSIQPYPNSFYYRLPSGCYVFWEIVYLFVTPSVGSLKGVFVRITGARFDFDRKTASELLL